jgi:hypothetical protein
MGRLDMALSSLKTGFLKGKQDTVCGSDLSRDGQIDFEEGKVPLPQPSPLESWCMQVPWWKAVADSISVPDGQHDPLLALSQLKDAEIDTICADAARSICVLFRKRARDLQKAYEAMDIVVAKECLESKFASFEASAGNLADYRAGLMGRVGMCAAPSCFSV